MKQIQETDREQSEFNDAISTLGRMNALIYSALSASLNLDAHTWFHSLRGLSRELNADMTSEEKTENKIYINKLDSPINKYTRKSDKGKSDISKELYELLAEFETFLRTIHDKAGYKTKKKDDPSRALGG